MANYDQCLHKIHDCVSPRLEHTTLTQGTNVVRFLRSEPGPKEVIIGIADRVQIDSTLATAAQNRPLLDFYLL